MSYPSAAHEIDPYMRLFGMFGNNLDRTGQVGESGIWEPVKWQFPGGHHLHTDYVGFQKEHGLTRRSFLNWRHNV